MSDGPVYAPARTVERFMRDDSRVRCIVGPIGSGKSSGCVVEAPRRASMQKPHKGLRRSRGVVVRNTYRELEDTTRKTFEQWVGGMGEWRESDFAFDIKGALGDGTDVECEVLFRALDRPGDVRKLLSLELTWVYFNEVREIAKPVWDGARGRIGRFPSMAEGGPSWYGLWADSNPWHTGHYLHRLFKGPDGTPPGFVLYEQPDALGPNAENLENLVPGYYADQVHGRDEEWIDEYLRSKYRDSVSGSVFGKALTALRARNGVGQFEHPSDGVHLTFDLGIADAMAGWFWRLRGNGVEFINHHEASGESLSYFFRLIRNCGYTIAGIWLPHDAKQRSLQTGKTVEQQFRQEFGDLVHLTPSVPVVDGIAAFRWLLEQSDTRFHARCSEVHGDTDIDGMDALASYRYDHDERHDTMRRNPLHDWASNTADSGRYVACAVRWAEFLAPKVRPPSSLDPAKKPSLNDLWNQQSNNSGGWGHV